MSKNLKELPFDQYQRYRDVQEIADIARGGGLLKALDVGGYPGIITDFLPNDEITVVDILPNDLPNYVQSDGSKLPFNDNNFDFVCSLDALEHVYAKDRSSFLEEMIRVSKDFIVLTCPFSDENIDLAEEITYDFYQNALGVPLEVLGEHLQQGLPRLKDVVDVFKNKKLDPIIIPSGYLFNWLPMQMAKVYSQTLPDYQQLVLKIDKFYNQNYYEVDHRAPSYRLVIVASKKSQSKLSKIENRFKAMRGEDKKDIKHFENFSMLMSLFDHRQKQQVQEMSKEVDKVRKILHDKDVHINNLERIIRERDDHIQNLEKWVAKAQSSVPYRLYSSVKKLKKNNKQ